MELEYKVIDGRDGSVWNTYNDEEEAMDVAAEMNAVNGEDFYYVEEV